jgi:hypothetical protein
MLANTFCSSNVSNGKQGLSTSKVLFYLRSSSFKKKTAKLCEKVTKAGYVEQPAF